jgi:hypothetical protein
VRSPSAWKIASSRASRASCLRAVPDNCILLPTRQY